jgi:hypothetical protein
MLDFRSVATWMTQPKPSPNREAARAAPGWDQSAGAARSAEAGTRPYPSVESAARPARATGPPAAALGRSLAVGIHRLVEAPLGTLRPARPDRSFLPSASRPDFLGTGPRRVGLPFPGIDASRAVHPPGVPHGFEPTIDLGLALPLDRHQEAVLFPGDCLEVRVGDHAPVADEDQPAEGKPLAQVSDDFLNRGMFVAIADGHDRKSGRPVMPADWMGKGCAGVELPSIRYTTGFLGFSWPLCRVAAGKLSRAFGSV